MHEFIFSLGDVQGKENLEEDALVFNKSGNFQVSEGEIGSFQHVVHILFVFFGFEPINKSNKTRCEIERCGGTLCPQGSNPSCTSTC